MSTRQATMNLKPTGDSRLAEEKEGLPILRTERDSKKEIALPVANAEQTDDRRCKDCGILMGPGHVESGIAERCGSCLRARKAAAA